ncbi:MAG: hypothetical protein NC111_06435 [Bacteroides sp.]|nr:hypothetical protein [Bacteroides sp.]MCM1413115.1 hypothetical protein [Bacteroides sp.]MCM1472143.1 hypothetical protein [Bacteroides sp.]
MKKQVEIQIGGVTYPCYVTIGALMRFKQLTGKDAQEINGTDMEDSIAFFYCCVASACNREGKPFDMALMDFADRVDVDDIQQWSESINSAEPEKKRPAKKSR